MDTIIDTTPFNQAREDLCDLLTTPVQAWMLKPSARRTDSAYQDLLTVPMDLAAAGFAVTVKQTESGWNVDLKRTIAKGSSLHLHGSARSYLSCLFQMANDAAGAVTRCEDAARKAAENELNEVAA